MNQDTPTTGLALRWSHPEHLSLWIGGGDSPPNVTLWPRIVLDSQVWLPVRDWSVWNLSLLNVLCLVTEESTGLHLWEGLKTDWLQVDTGWNWQDLVWLLFTLLPTWCVFTTDACNSGDPWPWRLSPLNLIPCIKYLIWLWKYYSIIVKSKYKMFKFILDINVINLSI